LDEKYVLVGRGLYSLKEWGYKKGTVADVVADVLNKAGEPMSRDEILNKVLEQRLVKKATIILALMDKNRFERVEGGKYKLRS
jgi:non-ribosomal peptide synthetase component E (peptide arylation enzyme)